MQKPITLTALLEESETLCRATIAELTIRTIAPTRGEALEILRNQLLEHCARIQDLAAKWKKKRKRYPFPEKLRLAKQVLVYGYVLRLKDQPR